MRLGASRAGSADEYEVIELMEQQYGMKGKVHDSLLTATVILLHSDRLNCSLPSITENSLQKSCNGRAFNVEVHQTGSSVPLGLTSTLTEKK